MERIGRYRITRELGRGSMSIVYEGFDDRIDRYLAIKVLRQAYARDVASRQCFLREARAAGGLGYPNIVTVFDVGQVDGLPFLVMELLSGQTLADFIAADKAAALPLNTMIEIAIQLAAALEFAHKNDVIHRDVKPSNIHFEPDRRLIKLMDFGIAAIDRGPLSTETGQDIVGTPHYMPPEQLCGKPLDKRSDLYSLGVVLFQLISGRLPYRGETVEAVIDAISRDTIRPLTPLHPETPKALPALVRRLMSADPGARPAGAGQVREELEDIQSARRRGILPAVKGNSVFWRWPAGIGAVIALVLALGLSHVYRSQTEALAGAVYGYGDALASIIAQETAEPLILGDTAALGMLVADFSVNPRVQYLHVSDTGGMIQASTNPFIQGLPKPRPAGAAVPRPPESINLIATDNGHLEFQVPVRFQAHRVGEIQLGINAGALQSTATTTLTMLAAVFGLILIVALAGLGWMTRRWKRSIDRIAWALKRLRGGQSGVRLDVARHDEFAAICKQFNNLAVSLDEQGRTVGGEWSAPVISTGASEVAPDETLDLNALERRSVTASD